MNDKIVFKKSGAIEVSGKEIGTWSREKAYVCGHKWRYGSTFKLHQYTGMAYDWTIEGVKAKIMEHVARMNNPYYKHYEEVEEMIYAIVNKVCDKLCTCDVKSIKLLMWTMFPYTTAICGTFERCDYDTMRMYLIDRLRDYAMTRMDEGNGLFSMRCLFEDIKNKKFD